MSILEHFAFSSHPHHATRWDKGEPEMEKLNFDILFVETFCLLRRNNIFFFDFMQESFVAILSSISAVLLWSLFRGLYLICEKYYYYLDLDHENDISFQYISK